MRWKLANGGVVASTKQPIKWRDFDRIVITDDSASWIFEDEGVPYGGDIVFTIRLYNPSTHTIKKSFHSRNTLALYFETIAFGNDGSRFVSVDDKEDLNGKIQSSIRLCNLDYGDVFTWNITPDPAIVNGHWSQMVTPWNIGVWGGSDLSDFYPDTFKCFYVVKLTNSNIGGRASAHGRTLQKYPYTVEYKIR